MNIIKNTFYLGATALLVISFAPQSFADSAMGEAVKHHAEAQDVSELVFLKHVESKYVCMVNNKLFDRVQIPTEVNGNIYYGCCSMCKAKLEGDKALREAIDPISGETVDKASAVIGAGSDRSVYYFENEENMKKFDASKASDL